MSCSPSSSRPVSERIVDGSRFPSSNGLGGYPYFISSSPFIEVALATSDINSATVAVAEMVTVDCPSGPRTLSLMRSKYTTKVKSKAKGSIKGCVIYCAVKKCQNVESSDTFVFL